MKKKILVVSLMVLFVFVFAGCDKEKKEEEKVKISIDCSMTDPQYGGDYGDQLTAVVYLKGQFNEEGYLASTEYTTIETSATDEIYNERKSNFSDETGKLDPSIKNDDAKRTLSFVTTNKTDFSILTDEQKKDFFASNQIRSLEERGYKCEITGATRASLGL